MPEKFKRLLERFSTVNEPFWIRLGLFGCVGPHHFGDGDLVSREALSRAVCERAVRRWARSQGLLFSPFLLYTLLDGKWNTAELYAGAMVFLPWMHGISPLQHEIKEPEPSHVAGALHVLKHSPQRRSARRDVMQILPSLLPGIQRGDDLSQGSWRDLLEIAVRSQNPTLRGAILDAMRRADAPELNELVESLYGLTDITSRKLHHAEASAVAAARYARRARAVIQTETGEVSRRAQVPEEANS